MNILDVIQGISNCIHKTHDGALDKDGQPVKIGLKREKGNPLTDKRVIDGFSIRFQGKHMVVVYQSEISLKDMHKKSFEGDIQDVFDDIISFIKKEYKSNDFKNKKGKTLKLKQLGEIDVDARSLNMHRSWVEASAVFEIGGLSKEQKKDNLNETIKRFLNFLDDE